MSSSGSRLLKYRFKMGDVAVSNFMKVPLSVEGQTMLSACILAFLRHIDMKARGIIGNDHEDDRFMCANWSDETNVWKTGFLDDGGGDREIPEGEILQLVFIPYPPLPELVATSELQNDVGSGRGGKRPRLADQGLKPSSSPQLFRLPQYETRSLPASPLQRTIDLQDLADTRSGQHFERPPSGPPSVTQSSSSAIGADPSGPSLRDTGKGIDRVPEEKWSGDQWVVALNGVSRNGKVYSLGDIADKNGFEALSGVSAETTAGEEWREISNLWQSIMIGYEANGILVDTLRNTKWNKKPWVLNTLQQLGTGLPHF